MHSYPINEHPSELLAVNVNPTLQQGMALPVRSKYFPYVISGILTANVAQYLYPHFTDGQPECERQQFAQDCRELSSLQVEKVFERFWALGENDGLCSPVLWTPSFTTLSGQVEQAGL